MNSVRRPRRMGIALGMGMLLASQAVQLVIAGPIELDPRVPRGAGDPISMGLHLDGLLHKVVGLHDKPDARRRPGRL